MKADLTLGDRAFECPACGWRVDRDYNASLNILRRAGWEPPAAPVELRPPARGPRLRARWGSEAGSPALKGGVAHLGVLQIDSAESAYTLVPAIRSDRLMYSLSLSAKVRPLSFFAPPGP